MQPDPQWFIDEDFRFRLGTVPGTTEEFFARSPDAPDVLKERHHWLTSDPQRYMAIRPDGVGLVGELLELVSPWPMLRDAAPLPSSPEIQLTDRFRMLSEQLEPDLVLLAPNSGNQFTVAAGCVCFPSSWRLTDKLGQSVEEVHQPVPQLNAALGPQIDRLLSHLRPGKCVVRANWSVCRQPELNQHPDRNLSGIPPDATSDEAWLRREDQCLFTLAKTGGVVFGIRVTHIAWRDLRSNPVAARSVARALRSMPPEMLEYKRLTGKAVDNLARLLETADDGNTHS
jgi:hypothetical protein